MRLVIKVEENSAMAIPLIHFCMFVFVHCMFTCFSVLYNFHEYEHDDILYLVAQAFIASKDSQKEH